MTYLIALAKKIKRILKKFLKPRAFISYSRRIERVKTEERICAMTFDDGPFALPASPDRFGGRALTDVLLDILKEYGAHGTFDVVGYTGDNYPDTCGAVGTPAWGGVRYDHYPDFEKDAFGGAVKQPDLVRRMIAEGHQVTNHGYQHIIFGRKPFVYGNRHFMSGAEEVLDDLTKLDDLLKNEFNYTMTMSRPPHYVDKIRGGFTSYDAYDAMKYQYMAASFDGGGWLPLENAEAEVEDMVAPLRRALEADPDALCGQIIFQKDGYNMAKRTPIALALPLQLELLQKYGYKVVTVNELLEHSAFADLSPAHPFAEELTALAQQKPIAYSDNTVRLSATMTNGALALLLAPMEDELLTRRKRVKRAMQYAKKAGLLPANARANGKLKLPLSAQAMKHFIAQPKSSARQDVFTALRKG